jgi:alcohol dehydrogenase class IV
VRIEVKLTFQVEALYAQDANPVTSLLALEGIMNLAEALPTIVDTPGDMSARSKAQYGAWLCGICLGAVGMSLHHKLCHTLGGSLGLPHAETHAIVLPHALAYNAPCIPDALSRLATVLPSSDGDAIRGLNSLLKTLRIDRALEKYGMKQEDVKEVATVATSRPYWNPREVKEDELLEVVRRCWAGEDARNDL